MQPKMGKLFRWVEMHRLEDVALKVEIGFKKQAMIGAM